MSEQIEVINPPGEATVERRSTERTKVEFSRPSEEADVADVVEKMAVPVFKTSKHYVLVRDLANLWNFPSSYQLIKQIVKQTGVSAKEIFKKTDVELNSSLHDKGVITEVEKQTGWFYTSLEFLYAAVLEKDVFLESDAGVVDLTPIRLSSGGEDKITISQVFPQYGLIDSTLEMDHASFNCLNSLSKINYYKTLPNAYRFLPNSKLSFFERELILRNHDVSEIKVTDNEPVQEGKRRKPVGRTKKHIINIDPNTIDLTDSVVPGQGYIQEFNVNYLCRVPNYYVNNGPQGSSGHGSKKGSNISGGAFGDSVKLSKNVQQLVYNNDNEGYSHSKYYYNRGYRGPGSGNFKDMAVINKLSKISTSAKTMGPIHKVHKDVRKISRRRYDQNVKGLVYDKFNKALIDATLSKHNEVEDFSNMEMLHNNVQFNVLLNSYREISEDTWRRYYKFKLIDFEQLAQNKRRSSSDILRRFTSPTAYREIMESIPVELRESNNDPDSNIDHVPSIKGPLSYMATYPDTQNPQVLNKIDVISFPNANSIGSENIKRYRRSN